MFYEVYKIYLDHSKSVDRSVIIYRGGGGGGREVFGSHMVFRGTEGISRRQKSMKWEIQNNECQLTENKGGGVQQHFRWDPFLFVLEFQ